MPTLDLEIPGFHGYRARSDGSIWSHRHSRFTQWRRLKPHINKDGHACYRLYDGSGNGIWKFGHQLVLMAFVGPCPAGMEGCHGDGNPANNQLSNLRWDTKKSNAEDCIRHGKRPRGEEHGRAKIVESQIKDIVGMIKCGHSYAEVGRTYNISPIQVRRIYLGLQWKHARR